MGMYRLSTLGIMSICEGEPTEWCSPKVFPTEEEAMKYYKLYIRPDMQRMMSKIEGELSDGTLVHRKLE